MSKCFCHLNGYEVKDATARKDIETLSNDVNDKLENLYVDTVIEMKSKSFTDGCVVKTLGYYSVNDGGEGLYKIRSKKESDIEDNGSIHIVSDNLVAELIVENNSVNVKQFGAKGDGITDDTTAIKKCFEYANTKKVKVLFDKSDYVVSSSIFIADNVSVDGGKATIIPTTGTYTQNCIFLINTEDGTNWVNPWIGNAVIENMDFKNTNKIEVKAFLLAQPNTKFENVNATSMYGLIRTPSLYLDNIQIIGCTCLYSLGDNYMIEKNGFGEGCLIQNCHFANDSDERNTKGISVRNSLGLEINNLLNGDVYLYRCMNTSINNAHMEHGSFTLENSIVSINDSYIWKREGIYPIKLIDEHSNAGYGHNNVATFTSLKNVIFECRYADYSYLTDSYDIFAEKYQKDIDVENCYRRSEPEGAPFDRMALTGIHVKTILGELKPQHDKYRILRGKLFTNDVSVLSESTQSASLLTGVTDYDGIEGTFENKTYYYKAMVMMDTKRLIKGQTSAEKSIAKSSTNGSRIGLGINNEVGCLIRLYRGTASTSYNQYVDIPNVKNTYLCDNGKTVNGFAWKDRTPGDVDVAGYGQLIESANKYTESIRFYSGSQPAQGTWKKGDIIINNNPSAGGVYGWICITEGTPGTWKAISTIAS
jgi:hypothetical protein